MAFSDTQDSFRQESFTIIEIDLPAVEGASEGYGTPITTNQPSNATATYRFTMKSSPLIPLNNVWRCVTSISESPTELQSGRGLSSRGTGTIVMSEFKGDPNPLAPSVTPEVINQGGFLAKLKARNVLVNKNIRIKNYRIGDDGQIPDLDSDAEVRHYIIESFTSSDVGTWRLKFKDELYRFDIDEKQWPIARDGYLRASISTTDTLLQVDPNISYQINDAIRIGSDLMTIQSVSNIGTSIAQVTTRSRAIGISNPPFSQLISKTEVNAHDAGDEIFLCKVYDNARIDTVLYDILTESGVDPSLIPLAEWQAEIDTWHSGTRITHVFSEAQDSNDVINMILESYMIDMWFDVVERKIKITAISEWQQSTRILSEGKEINYDTVRTDEKDDLRASDALVVYGKSFKARDDSTENFSKASVFTDPALSSLDQYGEPKQKRFPNNPVIDETAAGLLVRRYVRRYGRMPIGYKWNTEEKYLKFNVGEVVSLSTFSQVGFDGIPNTSSRAQIVSIKPSYNGIGRSYTVKALTYSPAVDEVGIPLEEVIRGRQERINLWDYIGQPIEASTYTFIFDAAQVFSNSNNIPAMTVGRFATGSVINIILANGASVQGKGGDGGGGAAIIYEPEIGTISPNPTIGRDGGVAIDCNSLGNVITVNIYFSGATPSAEYATANGFVRAPGGGGAGGFARPDTLQSGDGGGGGAGDIAGSGAQAGIAEGIGTSRGISGENGNTNGNGGDSGNGGAGGGWGEAGESSGVVRGGAAGKGVVDSGNTVNLIGQSGRYINGNGDHP